ncbi:hypothetical protein [uncultured Tessaracoccus sp.]|uniref:hypothetical protein n=1 Tax=uncultured Tessaracoccus sp. TaxID=905023 RepID=UPI0025DF08D8|nr:hypothetical protein [uncultured Tessaracoccus sp.]
MTDSSKHPYSPGVNALFSALLGASITVVIAFAVFMAIGFTIETSTTWMQALGMVSFGGTFMGAFITYSLKR